MVLNADLDKDSRLFSVLLRLARETGVRHVKGYVLALGLSAVVAGTTGAIAFMLEDVINEVFVNKSAPALFAVAFSVMVIFVLRGFAMFGQAVLLTQISNAIVFELNVKMFKKLMGKEPSFVLRSTTGELSTVIGNSSNSAAKLLNDAAKALGRDMFTLIALIGVLFIQDWKLSLAIMLGVPPIVFVISRIAKRLRSISRKQLQNTAALGNRIRGAVQGIRVVKSFNMESAITEAMIRNADEVRRFADKHAVISNRVAPFMEIFGGVAIAAAIAGGGWRVIQEGQTPGELVSFLFAALMAYDPARRLGNVRTGMEKALVGVRLMYRFLDAPAEQVDKPGAQPIKLDKCEIRFDDVRFGYGENEPVLNGLNLTVPSGRTTAIVGRSGAGKSTVASLLLRFWPADSGSVRIDGQDVDDVTVASVRDAIAYVGQDAFLFDGSIRENLLVGDQTADEARLRAAAEAAGALDFISALPDGFETEVGELGSSLSGGQRQRVAIARALLRDAPIVLLDEPTSALDAETERGIQASLQRLSEGRTTIIIAHRLSTIKDADQIVVMDGGVAVETGTHDSLMAADGAYARLHREAGPGGAVPRPEAEEPESAEPTTPSKNTEPAAP